MAPIKRHEALKTLSRDHHHGLLLCFKIRQGIKNGTSFKDIKKYLDFFFENHLRAHFREEEEHVFPVLGNDHPLVKTALSQHRSLETLFTTVDDPGRTIPIIENELEQHIRFEERQLFNIIQLEATTEQLKYLMNVLSHETHDPDKDWPDHFWKQN
ncbi:MAG: hemerythrin domain-containing protein [Bacteroidia bacterium]